MEKITSDNDFRTIFDKITPADKIILRKLAEAELCQRSLYEFFKSSTQVLSPSVEWDYNWHFEYLCDILSGEVERMLKKEDKERDYIINVPFRSGKSTLISIILPVWCWLKDPSISLITVSATEALAVKFSHQSKILIESLWFQERFGDKFKLRMDSKSKGNYLNDRGGRREAFGISGTILGSGCDIMLCDDLQSPENVTPLGLKNTIQSFQDVLYSRLNDPRINFRIIMQQRLRENDISGYLLKVNPHKWNLICIPAILTKDVSPIELIEHYEDGLFWPSRFSQKVINDFQSTMRSQMFAGQLLQRPTVEEGDVIKRAWFQIIPLSKILNEKVDWCMFLDTAYTNKTKNDPSGILIAGKLRGDIIIRKVYQRWLQFHELLDDIKEQQIIYNIKKIYVEQKASGISISQELKRQTTFSIIPVSPQGRDKMARVIACQPSMESGRVILVEDEWNELFLSEVASFPFGSHDDLVDDLSYSIEQLLSKGSGTVFKSR